MRLFRKYKIGFDIWGLVLFLIIMIPNFVWFGVPAPNDILRSESVTETLDTVASIFQMLLVGALCVIINVTSEKPMNKNIFKFIILFVGIYFIGWIAYYLGIVNPFVVLDLCVAPCIAFILFSIARKNAIALLSAIIFMICHILYGVINFVVI